MDGPTIKKARRCMIAKRASGMRFTVDQNVAHHPHGRDCSRFLFNLHPSETLALKMSTLIVRFWHKGKNGQRQTHSNIGTKKREVVDI